MESVVTVIVRVEGGRGDDGSGRAVVAWWCGGGSKVFGDVRIESAVRGASYGNAYAHRAH